MSYRATLQYLDSFINYEKPSTLPYKESFKLERIRDFLQSIGSPQDAFASVHVAGTKGKGSVCAFTAYMLRQLGYAVGLYTSPHLSDIRERIRILRPGGALPSDDFEGMIPAPELEMLVAWMRPHIEGFNRRSAFGPLSFFEVYTALAFEYFKRQEIDFAVLETGLGGRLDATNVVKAMACAITPISFDHTAKLGRTLAEIAREKAGIIKGPSAAVVSAFQEPEAMQVLKEKSGQEKAPFYEMGRDIYFTQTGRFAGRAVFNVRGALGEVSGAGIGFLGEHQVANATLAVGLIGCLARRGCIRTDAESLKSGLRAARWPGRCELFMSDPPVLIDGAHNRASAAALRQTLCQCFPDKQVLLVLGISQDKDIRGICQELVPGSKKVLVTCARNPRACPSKTLGPIVAGYTNKSNVVLARSVAAALALARKQVQTEDVIVVTGSLFVVGEARKVLTGKAHG